MNIYRTTIQQNAILWSKVSVLFSRCWLIFRFQTVSRLFDSLSLIMKSVITNSCLKNYNSWKFSWYFTCFTFTSHILHFFYLFSHSTVLKIVQIRYLFLLWKSKKDQDWWLQVLWLLSLGWLHEKLWSCVHQLHFQSVCTSSAPALKKLRPKFRQNGLTHTANIQVTDKKLLNL